MKIVMVLEVKLQPKCFIMRTGFGKIFLVQVESKVIDPDAAPRSIG